METAAYKHDAKHVKVKNDSHICEHASRESC